MIERDWQLAALCFPLKDEHRRFSLAWTTV